ncbi:MAG: hypothetical protein V4692_05220, partial [Bdellovibrionota bacterium]
MSLAHNFSTKLFIAIALLASNSTAFGDLPTSTGFKKKTICTVTINSREEKDSFQKYLHPDYFNFVELLRNKSDLNFLGRACSPKQQACDVVLISGHFGGGFTDNKEFFLPLEELEKQSCKTCPNVLGGATMVYLFGCNTLAGKNLDGRTPQEYYRVLIEEVGLEPAEARATVAVRYSAIGDSFTDRIRRVFKGSAVVAGFDSKAPLGEQIQPSINAYFSALPKGLKFDGVLEEWERKAISEAYFLELDRLKAAQTNGGNQSVFDSGKRLQPLFSSMVGGGYTDVPGIMTGTNESFVADKLCSMKSTGDSRLAAIEEIIGLGDRVSVVQMLPYLLDMSERGQKMNSDQKAFFERLSLNPVLREIVVGEKGIVGQLSAAPEELIKTVDLAKNLGWFSEQQQSGYYRQAAVYVWNNAGGFLKNKTLMKKLDADLQSVQAEEIQPAAFKGDAVWSLIASKKADQPGFTDLAKANLTASVAYYFKIFEKSKLALENPKITKESIFKYKEKIKEANRGIDVVCSTAAKLKPVAAEAASILASERGSLEKMSADQCLRLL